jgi:type VII secretion integral membrane protein EccD
VSLSDSALVRVTVASATRRVDLALPGAVPVAELVPELARSVGLLDATTVHGGYRLHSLGGRELAPDVGLASQDVEDGAVITVTSGTPDLAPRAYDDVVEAMADAVERAQEPWNRERGRRTALSSTGLLMSLGAIALLAQHRSAVAATAAGLVAVALVVSAIVLSRSEVDCFAVVTVAWLGVGYSAAAGALVWWDDNGGLGRPLAAGGSATMFTGAVLLLTLREGRALLMAPVLLGAAFAGAGLATDRLHWDPAVALTSVMTCLVLAGSIFPWLALGLGGTDVDRLLSVADITADPGGIDLEQVRTDARIAHEILLGLSLTVGLLMISVAPLAVSLGVTGSLVAVMSCLVAMLRTREYRSGDEVLVGLVSGVLGLVSTGSAVLLQQPGWRPVVALALTASGAALLATTLLPGPRSVRRARLGDLVANLALVSLLPLLVVAVGLLDAVRGRR